MGACGMRFRWVLLCSILLIVTSPSRTGLAQCRFEDPIALNTRGDYGDVVTADLDQDGRPDIVSTTGSNSLLIFLGAGGGAFRPAVQVPLPTRASRVEAADLDKDGRLDLVVLLQRGLAVLISRGGGAFAPAVEYPEGGTAWSFLVADLDSDGAADVAVARASYEAAILRGRGDGTLEPAASLGHFAFLLATGDFNGDGKRDLALLRGSGSLQVLLGDGAGRFPNAVSTELGLSPVGLGAADLNADGRTDLVVTSSWNPGVALTTLRAKGDGSFSSYRVASSTAYDWPLDAEQRFVLADLDRDGRVDVLVRTDDVFPGYPSGLLGALMFFRGSEGRFLPPVSFPANQGMLRSALAAADFDGDGKLDVATPGRTNGSTSDGVQVLLNGCGTYEWLLPSSARAQGSGGAFYTTDLSFFNLGAAGSMTLKFLGHDVDGRSGESATFSVPAMGSNTYRDVLGTVFRRTSGYGALLIRSDLPDLAVVGQTSTLGSGGTFGQSVPALARSEGIGPAGKPEARLPGIREDGAFRTNLILVNFSDQKVDVLVRLYGSEGYLAGKNYTLLPKQMTQVSRVARDLGVTGDVGSGALRLRLLVPGGGLSPSALVVAYAAVIDNVTNDPRTILAR